MSRWMVAGACLGVLVLSALAQPPLPLPRNRPESPSKEPFGDPGIGRPLPKGTIARLGSPRLRSRSDYSHGMQFSPDGRQLVLAASRDDLWWFDLATGRTLHRAEYPVGGIQCGRLLDGGALLLFHSKAESDNARHFITKYEPKARTVISEIKVAIPAVDHAEFDRPGERVFVARDKTLSVFDARTGAKLWSELLEKKPNTAPAFLPDGSAIAVGTDTGLMLRDARTGQLQRELDRPDGGKPGGYSAFVGFAQGPKLAASAGQERVIVWNTDTGRVVRALPKQKLPLGFAADGRLLTVSASGAVGIWNVETGGCDGEFPIPVADRACVSPEGGRIATRLHDCVIVYDVPAQGAPRLAAISAELPGLPDEMQFAPDGTLVGRLSEWGGWAVWSPGEPAARLVRPAGRDTVIGLAGDRRVVLTATEKQFVIADLDGTHPAKFSFDLSTSGTKRLAALADDGRVAVAVHEDGLARYDLSTRTARVLRSRFANRGAGTVAAISADGRLAATEGYDAVSDARHIELFALETNRPVREIPLRGVAERLAFTPDGRRLAIAYLTTSRDRDQQKNLLVVEPLSGRELLRIEPVLNGSGPRLALAPDGRTAAWVVGHEVHVYELVSGRLRSRLDLQGAEAHAVALAGDGRTLAVAGPGWPVILWDLGGPAAMLAPGTEEWEAVWRDLADTSAETAYRAARRMRSAPGDAVAFLGGKLKAAAPPEPAMLAQAIGALDAPAFADRQKATKDLRALGELAIPELTRQLETTESAEVRIRIEGLLKQGHKPTAEAIRAVRAVEVLEWLGTAEADALLASLAGGADGALQTREAIAARTRRK